MMYEMNHEEMLDINGGGWKAAGAALVGTLAVGTSVVTAVAAGPRAGIAQAKAGVKAIKWACDNSDQ